MTAWVNEQGIRFKGVMGFQTASPKGTLETLLDKLGARIQQSGKGVFMESADEMVVYHTIPDVEAVSILQEFGIEAHLAGAARAKTTEPLTSEQREKLRDAIKVRRVEEKLDGKN
ncbi:MAG: hypothetical protein WBV26_12650 [Candidatus Sulfotelmatobacter sp.]|jgi:hypothetical protein